MQSQSVVVKTHWIGGPPCPPISIPAPEKPKRVKHRYQKRPKGPDGKRRVSDRDIEMAVRPNMVEAWVKAHPNQTAKEIAQGVGLKYMQACSTLHHLTVSERLSKVKIKINERTPVNRFFFGETK